MLQKRVRKPCVKTEMMHLDEDVHDRETATDILANPSGNTAATVVVPLACRPVSSISTILTQLHPERVMKGKWSGESTYSGTTHAVTDNSRNSSVVLGEELGLRQVRGVQVLRAVRKEVKACDNGSQSVLRDSLGCSAYDANGT